jgi:DNA/RNA endonuclease G (NUC1)
MAVFLGMFSPCLMFQARAFIDISLQMQLGNPSSAAANTNNHAHYLIQRTIEAIDYNDTLGEPNWASWDLTAGDANGAVNRQESFAADTNLPAGFHQVGINDYAHSGYDRGHLCPSADRTDSTNDNNMTFLMSNMMPQAPNNNEVTWAGFEDYCRSLAQSTNNYELLIICGPSGFNGAHVNTNGYVAIPQYTWKIAVVVPPGTNNVLTRITATNRVIAIKVPNTNGVSSVWQNFITSASQIEVDTGLTFFTALPADVATVLRNKVDGQTNPPPVVFAFSPPNGAAGTNVILTGTNFATATAVTFNGVSAAFTVNSSTQITAAVPPNGVTGFISVTTPSGTAISSNSFTVIGGNTVYTGTLIGWDVSTQPGGAGNYGPSLLPPTTNAPNLTTIGLTRGSGVVTNGNVAAGQAWGGLNFSNATASLAIASNRFVTFSVAPNAGYSVSFTAVSRFDYRRSPTGPTNGVLQYQIGSGAFTDITNFLYPVITSGGGSIGAIDLTGFADLQNVGAGTNVTFRIINYLGTSSSGSWYISDVAGSSASDLALNGTVNAVITPTPLETWRLFWFGTTNNTGPAADTHIGGSDGMANLLKYALGLNPTTASTNPVTGDITTGHLRLTTTRNPNATDVTFSGEVSGNLTTWTTNGTVVDQNSAVFQVHDSAPVAGGTNRFLRLRVTSP